MKKTLIFILIVFVMSPFLFWPKPAAAVLGGGGRILSTIPCINGLLLLVGPVPPLNLMPPRLFMWDLAVSLVVSGFTLTPTIHMWYQLEPGPQVLINYTLGGVCIEPFFVIPAFGTILNIGTSAF
jgi:hypothetical protein